MIEQSELFSRGGHESDHNIAEFMDVQYAFPQVTFFFANRSKAPWHIQAFLSTVEGDEIELNFWPHTGKAYRKGGKSVQGGEAIKQMVAEALEDAQERADLIE